jgi:hypothetical protein
MCKAYISTIQGLITYVKENSVWQTATIRNVITALGYNPADERIESRKEGPVSLSLYREWFCHLFPPHQ